jgi:uncharacterized membrane protein
MDIALPIQIHLLVVIPAIVLGLVNLLLAKGTRFHKINGKLWVCLMLIAAFSSFFIMPTGSLTWLHLFAIVVIVSVLIGVIAIRNHKRRLHLRCMLGAYIGTIISAIFAASVTGRLLHELVYKTLF